jgi:hypothetical protein
VSHFSIAAKLQTMLADQPDQSIHSLHVMIDTLIVSQYDIELHLCMSQCYPEKAPDMLDSPAIASTMMRLSRHKNQILSKYPTHVD